MRTFLLATAFGSALLLAWGCGGKVFVDGQSAGAGGSVTGGTESSSESSSSEASASTGGAGVTCNLQCGGPIGVCGCSGTCSDGKMRAVGCGGAAPSGFVCTCDEDGQTVGTCNELSLVCNLPQGCCAAVFGL